MAADNIAALHMGLCLVEKQKDEKGIEPAHVLYEQLLSDIASQVKDELRNMCKQKLIVFHKTLNSVSFEIV